MKKLLAIVLSLILVLGMFAACGNNQTDTTTEPDSVDNNITGDTSPAYKLVKDGVLTVSLSPDFSPMEFVDPTKSGQEKFVGFDVSLAKYIASEMGLTLEILPMDFDACQASVASGKVDMSISGYSATEKRAANYNLSDYYYAGENETEQVLITLASNGDKYKDAANVEGLKVGAQVASLQEQMVTDQLTNATLVTYTDINTGLQQLKKGDFDAMAVAIGNANALIAKNPDVAMSGFQFVVDESEMNNVVLLKKGADALTETVNDILAKAEAAGHYETWYDEALNTAGVDISYDADGNPIVDEEETTEETVEDVTTDTTVADTTAPEDTED